MYPSIPVHDASSKFGGVPHDPPRLLLHVPDRPRRRRHRHPQRLARRAPAPPRPLVMDECPETTVVSPDIRQTTDTTFKVTGGLTVEVVTDQITSSARSKGGRRTRSATSARRRRQAGHQP